MIKQVYQVQVKDRFGYADTLEQAKELEDTFKTSFGGEAATSLRSVGVNVNSIMLWRLD